MPSPFPGMDPYLEDSVFWHGVHTKLIVAIAELLTPLVRPRFWVDTEKRVYVERENGSRRMIEPDVAIAGRRDARSSGGTAVLAPGFVEVEVTAEPLQHDYYLQIRKLPGKEVVTVIEVLSPWNKRPGEGMSEYVRKRNEVLASPTSLVEIDLLREGERPAYEGSIPPHNYLTLVHRAWEYPKAWAKGWELPEPIPHVPVPLLCEDSPVFLDLAKALTLVYDRGGYDMVLDYSKPPAPPLSRDLEGWARDLLASRRSSPT
ncbi:MAG: DUF4058 family protein [Planctomycetes bacterium]|nr:DUF4058 family protein [Planctomycetota bacterium]